MNCSQHPLFSILLRATYSNDVVCHTNVKALLQPDSFFTTKKMCLSQWQKNPLYNLSKREIHTLGQKSTFYPEITKNFMFEKCDFYEKCEFENVNFVKNDILKK